jgi:hypothetical protein
MSVKNDQGVEGGTVGCESLFLSAPVLVAVTLAGAAAPEQQFWTSSQ